MKKETFEQLKNEIELCKKCSLWKTRNVPLVGDGTIEAEIVFIGEAPGREEDIQGKAFVGRAGQVLNQLLDLVDLKRENIYITNILKCHPPNNQDPKEKEIAACINYLFRQLKAIQPKIIITLGKYASQTLFNRLKLPFSRITDMHGKICLFKASYGEVKIIPMYHPAAACHNPSLLNNLENDMKNIIKILR